MKTYLKFFFIYVDDIRLESELQKLGEERAESVTVIAELTKEDCAAAKEKASESLADRQDLRNVNLPILHSKIFYYPDELAAFADDERKDLLEQNKKLMKYFIELITNAIKDAFNGLQINNIEYTGLRQSNPTFSSKQFSNNYGTGTRVFLCLFFASFLW